MARVLNSPHEDGDQKAGEPAAGGIGGRPTLWQLSRIFTRIALTSFGGGVSGWMLREFVRDRKWMTQEAFLAGLSVCQALPGVNVTNLAIWIGFRLRGTPGAVVGLLSIVVPAAVVIVLLGTLFASLARFELTHFALAGAAAAAIGLSLSVGLTAAWAVPRKLVPLCIMAGTFVGVGVFQLPLVWTVLAAGSIGVIHAYLRADAP